MTNIQLEERFKVSEIFGQTFQGEGQYTGIPTVWVRQFSCNFNCSGFGQKNLDKPETWELPYKDIDPTKYKSVEELPVFSFGCDSSYSWAAKFKNLIKDYTAKEICDELEKYLRNEYNLNANFLHAKSKQWTHLAFTGGESMLPRAQRATVAVLREFKNRNNFPHYITTETNSTQKLTQDFIDFMKNDWEGSEWFWSSSPKLYTSGEKWDKAIRPEILASYNEISNKGQLKYVVEGSQRTWDEVDRATELYRAVGVNWPVWIMPVGADLDGQNKVAASISDEAIKRGYNVSGRMHVYIYGNVIGK